VNRGAKHFRPKVRHVTSKMLPCDCHATLDDRRCRPYRRNARIAAERKAALMKLLNRSSGGIQYVWHVEGDGEEAFEAACDWGLEGIVSKRLTALSGGGGHGWGGGRPGGVVAVPAGAVAITVTDTSASEDLSNQLRPPFGTAFLFVSSQTRTDRRIIDGTF
jgi:hypothetical protein